MRRRNRIGLGDPRVQKALAEMGVTPSDIQRIRGAKSQAEGDRLLSALKEKCKRGYRDKALELHPDRTNNDPEKADLFKWYKSVYEGFMAAGFKYRPPVRLHSPFRVYPAHGNANVTWTNTTGTTSYAVDMAELIRNMHLQNVENIKRQQQEQADIAERMRKEAERVQREIDQEKWGRYPDEAKQRFDRISELLNRKKPPTQREVDDFFRDSNHRVYPDGGDDAS